MKITKYPQSAFVIEYKQKKILIDPGRFCYNEDFTFEHWGDVDILLITHIHSDHFVPEAVRSISQKNANVIILTNREVKETLDELDVPCRILEPNQKVQIGDITITGVRSIHGPIPGKDELPNVIGFLIDSKVYHPGDTIYMYNKPKAEILMVPISAPVTMGIEGAAKFAKEINPKLIIPMHYDNPKYPEDPEEFVKAMEGYPVRILQNRQTIMTA